MKSKIFYPAIIFLINLFFYALFNYGGIRSPDSEIVFRTTESLVLRNEFAVLEPISFNYFGLGPGIDGKRYSIFGPAQSILTIPLLKVAYWLKNKNIQIIDSTKVPLSFHINNDNQDAGLFFLKDKRPSNLNGHFERFIVSFFNVLVGALSGVIFFYLILNLTGLDWISFYTTFLFSFGSLIFAYMFTFFSEPLCTLFIILSFYFIIKNEKDEVFQKQKLINYLYSGLFLGLAITSHISAVLSLPFYYLFILGQQSKSKLELKQLLKANFYFTIGLTIFCGLLLYYNYARFGNILETGRSADPLFHYAIYSNPIPGLFGLLFAPGKGLFIYSPIVLLSIIFWKQFHRKYPHLSISLIGMILVRLFFLASRSDWHAGFALGPRYLVIIIPFFFIPIAIGLKNIVEKQKLTQFIMVSVFSFICIVQQLFFSIGEIFSFLHIIFRHQKELGVDILANNSIYLNWKYSPALYLLNYKTGPFLLKFITDSNYMLWLIMTVIFAIMFYIIIYSAYEQFLKKNLSNPYM